MSRHRRFLFWLSLLAFGAAPPRAEPADPVKDKDIAPTQVTITGDAVELKDALARLKKQTGITVLDLRRQKSNPPLKLDLRAVPFWQALDTIAAGAKASVSLYQREGRIALVEGTGKRLPVSYSGVFRTVVKRVAVARDLETDTSVCTLTLEVAWEPRFQPFYLDQGGWSVAAPDGKGKQTTTRREGTGATPVAGRSFLEFELRFPAPPRSVGRIVLLRGKLALITPSKMLTFTFAKLAKRSLEKEGVTVRVRKVATEDDPWEVEVGLDSRLPGPRFESYQSWLVNNAIYLENKRTKRKYRPRPGDYQIKGQPTYPRARIVYYFRNKKGVLGNPRNLKLVYRTPGRIVTLPVRYEFKDLPLP
jgi:hypothetical protein